MIFYKSTITHFVRDFSDSSIFVPLSISVYFGLAVFPFLNIIDLGKRA